MACEYLFHNWLGRSQTSLYNLVQDDLQLGVLAGSYSNSGI